MHKRNFYEQVPENIRDLLAESDLVKPFPDPESKLFHQILSALNDFIKRPPHVLPLTSTLPDMKAGTPDYIRLQKLYRVQAEEEKQHIKTILKRKSMHVDEKYLDLFVKSVNDVRLIKGRRWESTGCKILSTGEKSRVEHMLV